MNFDQKVGHAEIAAFVFDVKKFQHAQQDVEHPHPITLPFLCDCLHCRFVRREIRALCLGKKPNRPVSSWIIVDFHHSSTLTCVLKKSCPHKISQGHDEDGTSEDINNQQYCCCLLIFLAVSN